MFSSQSVLRVINQDGVNLNKKGPASLLHHIRVQAPWGDFPIGIPVAITVTGKLQALNTFEYIKEHPVQTICIYTGGNWSSDSQNLLVATPDQLFWFLVQCLIWSPLFILVSSDSIKGTEPTSSCSLDIFLIWDFSHVTYISILVASER